jgi:hypothetical protein
MPRAGLSPQRVANTACDLADEIGLPNLTMALLAKQLGVRQPSLDNHVDGLPAQLRAISIECERELADVLPWSTVGRSGADAPDRHLPGVVAGPLVGGHEHVAASPIALALPGAGGTCGRAPRRLA